jgi:glycerophosphoryl diester phosphodiesterase
MTATGAATRPACLSLPPVIGHRGAAASAPENTLAGFRRARALGCEWVEFDVQLTGDQALVIYHDWRLDRTTNGSGAIAKLPLPAIRQLDAGAWFGPGFAGETVPTLDETLLLCRELGLGANIEIKAERDRARATAAAVAAALDRLAGHLPPVLISSFEQDAIAEAAERAPAVPRAMLWRKIPRNYPEIASRLGCTTVHADQVYLLQPIAAAVIAAGYALLAYTVNNPARAIELFGWGLTSVFSDAPDIILAALAGDMPADGRRRALR